jgi:hypothetical protein
MTSQTTLLSCVFLSAAIIAVCVSPALNHRGISEAFVNDAPKKCTANVSTECLADACCNWYISKISFKIDCTAFMAHNNFTFVFPRCDLSFNLSIGFCLPILPKPVPTFVCQRPSPICASLLSSANCARSDNCRWVPTGPPWSSSGLCIYDWDLCFSTDATIATAAFERSW